MCLKHKPWRQENKYRILFPSTRFSENGKRISLKEIELGAWDFCPKLLEINAILEV